MWVAGHWEASDSWRGMTHCADKTNELTWVTLRRRCVPPFGSCQLIANHESQPGVQESHSCLRYYWSKYYPETKGRQCCDYCGDTLWISNFRDYLNSAWLCFSLVVHLLNWLLTKDLAWNASSKLWFSWPDYLDCHHLRIQLKTGLQKSCYMRVSSTWLSARPVFWPRMRVCWSIRVSRTMAAYRTEGVD